MAAATANRGIITACVMLATIMQALFSLMRNLGSTIGISFVTSMLGRNIQVVHSELSEFVTPFNGALMQPGAQESWNLATTAGRLSLNDEITRQATIISYNNDFKLMMIVALAALPMLLLLRGAKRKPGGSAEAILD